MFRIGGNTFYDRKNKIPMKIPESKRSEIGKIAESRGIPNGFPNLDSKHWRGAQGLMWGARGPFLPAAAMVVAVVTPVVFCAKATEKRNKNRNLQIVH